MKENRKRWTPLLTCGLFCVLLLSGCSGMMQSLADGTDAVLNGLAEGTDQVAGALADMTDADCSMSRDCVHMPAIENTASAPVSCIPHGVVVMPVGGDREPDGTLQ